MIPVGVVSILSVSLCLCGEIDARIDRYSLEVNSGTAWNRSATSP
jgi:hypothetical protein